MKGKAIAILLLIVLLGLSCSPSIEMLSDRAPFIDYVSIDKEKHLYCSKYEVTNKEYRLFLEDLKENDYSAYEKCSIDSLKWNLTDKLEKSMGKAYGWHPAFDNHPVVNISFFGASKYCEWLNNRQGDSKWNFRLPSEQEFSNMLMTLDTKISSDDSKDYKRPNFNLYFEGNPSIDGGRLMVDARDSKIGEKKSFIQHKNGLLHLVGNVSEFLNDGRAMGGSWNSLPSEIGQVEKIEEPNPMTGFRVWKERVKN